MRSNLAFVAILVILAFAASARGATDIREICTPESLASNALGIKNVGTWNCLVTNYSDHAVIVTPGMLLAAVPKLHPIDPRRAALLVKQANEKSVRSSLMKVIRYGAVPALAFMGGGAITASKLAIAGLGAGTNVVRDINDDLKAGQPDLSAFASVIPERVSLAAFQSKDPFEVTFTVYASKMKGADTLQGIVYFPADVAPTTKAETVPAVKPLVSAVVNNGWDTGTGAAVMPQATVTHSAGVATSTPTLSDYELSTIG